MEKSKGLEMSARAQWTTTIGIVTSLETVVIYFGTVTWNIGVVQFLLYVFLMGLAHMLVAAVVVYLADGYIP